MRVFKVDFTGDHLDQNGSVAGCDIGVEALEATGYIKTGFLWDQKPSLADADYWERYYSLEITPEHVAGANGIVVCRPWVRESAFAAGAENLVIIERAGAGYDKIDLDACTRNEVVVCNVPDSLTHSTASAALTLLLALAKRLPQQERVVRSGRWDQQYEVVGDDLIGKTLGIVGLGKTGNELARLVAPFHMRVQAYSPRADADAAEEMGITLVSSLDELLSEADFVSLHCRLEDSTRGLLGARELSLLKTSAYLINVARGELVDEEALIAALQERRIAGAGLDVFDHEPLLTTSPLLHLDNVVLTPHWLPSTQRAARLMRQAVVNNVSRVAQGRQPNNVLNPQVLGSGGFARKLARFRENHMQ
jgi:phosphoglycerate dehydrogenase-like enzyme